MYIYHLEKNGIPFYVGRASCLVNRFADHKKRFGNDIEIKEIEQCDYGDSAELETKYIVEYLGKYGKLENKHIGKAHHERIKKRLNAAISKMQKPKKQALKPNKKLKKESVITYKPPFYTKIEYFLLYKCKKNQNK